MIKNIKVTNVQTSHNKITPRIFTPKSHSFITSTMTDKTNNEVSHFSSIKTKQMFDHCMEKVKLD
jgi:hypothetical protein